MASNDKNTVRECASCEKNRVRLIKWAHPIQLFPATRARESIVADILGPIPEIQHGFQFILGFSDLFGKQTQVLPLRRIASYDVWVAFKEHCVLKYGVDDTVLTVNGPQFAEKFFAASTKHWA